VLTLTIVTILCGTVLGLRYKIFILLPAAMFMLVFVIGVGVARGAGIWRIALDMTVAMTALQLGYAGGSAFAAARALRSSFLPYWHHDFRKLVSGIDSKPFGYLAWQPHSRSPSAANRGNFKRALGMRSAEF
jgi:hypothetical protein